MAIGKALGDAIAGYRDGDNERAAGGLVRAAAIAEAGDALKALIDLIEGPFGWATARNALGERLNDHPSYVSAYLAARSSSD
jgi:hypothetical protein